MWKRKKYLIFVLFLEVVTLTFVLQTSLSIGFLLLPSGICVPSFIKILHIVLKISCRNETRGFQEPVIAHLLFNFTSKVNRKWGGGAVRHIFERDPLREHSCQVWLNLIQQFKRRRFKCDLLSKSV